MNHKPLNKREREQGKTRLRRVGRRCAHQS